MNTAEDIILNKIEEMRPEWEKAGMLNFLLRIQDMYLRECEFIKDTKEHIKFFEKQGSFLINLVKQLNLTKEYKDIKSFKDCITEEDIANRAMDNVNQIYNSYFNIA